jgi:ABC-type proline/glycine betaine transport system substrate-binding protein
VQDPILLGVDNWNSSYITSTVASILLREVMKLPATMIYALDIFQQLDEGTGVQDLHLEFWAASLYPGEMQKYVREDKTVVELGPLGVVARNGWCVDKRGEKKMGRIGLEFI